MKILLTILTILTFFISAFGQHSIGIKTNCGLSKISNPFVASNVTSTTQFAFSGQGGFFYNFLFSKKSLIGTELLFVQIESKEKWVSPATDQTGNPTGEFITDNVYKHISYIGIPIYYGFKLNKLTINVGGQATFALASSGRYKTKFPDNGSIISWDTTYNKLNIDTYDFGLRAGLIFNLTNRFSVEGTYYYGLNNIFKNNVPNDWKWKVQQMTIGLRYNFITFGSGKSMTNNI